MADNTIFSVNGEGLERLRRSLALRFIEYRKAIGYANPTPGRLVFFWAKHNDAIYLPAPLDSDAAAALAWEWLKTAEYPTEPDHDGDNEEGWHAFCEEWGHVSPFGYQAFVAIDAQWMMYGK